MWNQWPSGPPPMPPSSTNSQPPLIGPIQPGAPAPPPIQASQTLPAPPPTTLPAVPAVQAIQYQSGAPTYTPAQYAAMTPEQQYAVQQHWQQWQAYEQQYAQWHAQYGEQYKREMAAIQSTPQPAAVPYNSAPVTNAYNFPPPAISNTYQMPPVPVNAPPPPPPDDNSNSKGIKAPAQLYEQPPPPPPPPQETPKPNRVDPVVQSENLPNSQGQNPVSHSFLQNQGNQWNQPPPFSVPNSENRWNQQHDGPPPPNQQNQQNQQNRPPNQFNQQDRPYQNNFNQQFNNGNQQGRQNQNNNSRYQQENEQARNNRQGNWQNNNNNNNFRGRNRSRNGNNFEGDRQFDDSDGRNNYQPQSWQSDNSAERNNRGNFSNRFDNSYDNFNRNLGQNQQQQGPNNWNNNAPPSGNFGTPENFRQKQSSQNQSTPNEKPQNSTSSGSVDEKAFDEQFRMWEEQFENWKKENANHPDRAMYSQYEREFEKTRVRLLERREQMRRRKMMEMQQKSNSQMTDTRELSMNQQTPQTNPLQQNQQQLQPHQPQPPQPPQPPQQPQQPQLPQQPLQPQLPQQLHQQPQQPSLHPETPQNSQIEKSTEKIIEVEKPTKSPELKPTEDSNMEHGEPEVSDSVLSTKIDDQSLEVENKNEDSNIAETNIFKKQEITDLFKSGGGIPGLDLVGSKDGDDVDAPKENDNERNANVIDLDNDGPTRPPKLPATLVNSGMILTAPQPQQMPPNLETRSQPLFSDSQSQNTQPAQRKIPSLFDIVVEKPVLSPDNQMKPMPPVARNSSPAGSRTSKSDILRGVDSHSRSISRDRDALVSPSQRPLSQMSTEQNIQESDANEQVANLPPQAADLAKALQDPNVMQLLTVALAQAQKSGCINPNVNSHQNQLLQQLQQLQPLIQMQQERNFKNRQSQPPQSWQNQNQNQNQNLNLNQNQNFENRFNTNMNQNENLNNRFNSSMNQNRNQFDNNSMRNDDRLSQRSGSTLSDGNKDMSQKNPRNPFRRGNETEDKGMNLDITDTGRDAFMNTNNNNFGGPNNLQQQRGGGSFENDNNFGRGNFMNDNFGRGGNFSNDNFGRDFGVGRGNFGGRNFTGRNFDDEDFNNRGGDNPRDNNYDRHNFDGDNSAGGGNFNNRPDTSFNNSLGYRNNTNNFGDRGIGNNDYFRPTQIFDYQNRSRPEALIPPAKVVDYGHKPSALLPAASFSRDNSEFVPVKTIDYGHAKPANAFQDKDGNQTQKKINRWNQDQNQQQQRNQNQDFRGNENQSNSTGMMNNRQQNENPSQKNTEDFSRLTETEKVKELESEDQQDYPKNKWILQNPETRQRPGPPTKRGKRNFVPEPIKDQGQSEPFENDEIEENFEEISDNECVIEDTNIPPQNTQIKKKSVSLFPSVSDSNKTPSMIIPSNENNNTIPIDEILFKPGRLTRPKNIVVIMRGPPGSGKSHVAKLIKDKEVEMGGHTPRLLSVDDYFMVENDYEEKCPKTGRKIPKKEILYEYEKEMEPTYMQYLIKSFKKTVTDHLFDFIIVDCCNQSLRTVNEFYNAARDGNFSPFVVDLKCNLEKCLDHNVHHRKEEDIKEIIDKYQDCPGHYIKLDVSNLLENVVEMEDVSDLEDHFAADSEIIELDDEEDEASDNNDDRFLKSKWDSDPTTENLARLDGTSKPISKRGTATLEEYLQIDGWEPPSSNTDGKKRVRWADIEEKRAQDKMRAIGFVVGQTDWNRMMDPTSGSGALTKTKYIERLNKRR